MDEGISMDVTIKFMEKGEAVGTIEHQVTEMEEDEVDTVEVMTQTEEDEGDTVEVMTQTEEDEVDTVEVMTQTEELGAKTMEMVGGETTEAVHIKVGVMSREVADTEEIEEDLVGEDTTPLTMEDNDIPKEAWEKRYLEKCAVV